MPGAAAPFSSARWGNRRLLARLIHRPRRWRRTTLVLLPLLAAVLLIGSLEADWDFGRITKLAEKRYGPTGQCALSPE